MIMAFIALTVVTYLGVMFNILYRVRDPFTVRLVRKFSSHQKPHIS